MTAVTACRTCGTELLENARFCHGRGSAVAVADTHAEYKQVTVLFADVVHSMEIASAVGAERLREIMTELVNCSTMVVQRFGGTVDKFTGDGVMAVFGRARCFGGSRAAGVSGRARYPRRECPPGGTSQRPRRYRPAVARGAELGSSDRL
jgi:class 3 adenylate cyclase